MANSSTDYRAARGAKSFIRFRRCSHFLCSNSFPLLEIGHPWPAQSRTIAAREPQSPPSASADARTSCARAEPSCAARGAKFLVSCFLSLVSCPLSLVPCPLSLVSCLLSLVPCSLSLASFAHRPLSRFNFLLYPREDAAEDVDLGVAGFGPEE